MLVVWCIWDIPLSVVIFLENRTIEDVKSKPERVVIDGAIMNTFRGRVLT